MSCLDKLNEATEDPEAFFKKYFNVDLQDFLPQEKTTYDEHGVSPQLYVPVVRDHEAIQLQYKDGHGNTAEVMKLLLENGESFMVCKHGHIYTIIDGEIDLIDDGMWIVATYIQEEGKSELEYWTDEEFRRDFTQKVTAPTRDSVEDSDDGLTEGDRDGAGVGSRSGRYLHLEDDDNE